MLSVIVYHSHRLTKTIYNSKNFLKQTDYNQKWIVHASNMDALLKRRFVGKDHNRILNHCDIKFSTTLFIKTKF